jgi:peptidoglycan/xylan/chitin deacetylase (PgdA/CDA1 family)
LALSKYIPGVRRLVSASLYRSGGTLLFRRIGLKGRVTVVFYHDIVERNPIPELQLFVEHRHFWSHVDALDRRYGFFGLGALAAGEPRPPRPLVLTFDGYSRNFLPVARRLSERRIPALFYLITEPIFSGRPHWHQRLFFALRNAKKQLLSFDLDGERVSYPVPGEPGKNLSVSFRLVNRIETHRHKHDLVDSIASECNSSLEEFDRIHRPLTPKQIREMSSLPGIEIGSHSHTHPRHLDPAAARFELQTSKRHLEEWTGKPVVHYAYPEGRKNQATLKLLPEVGYHTAAASGSRFLDSRRPEDWPYAIPRFMLGNSPFSAVAGRLTGWERVLDALIGSRHERRRNREHTQVNSTQPR